MKEFANILKYARPYTKSIIFAFACLLLTSMISLALPLIVRNMINAVVVLKNSDLLNSLTRDLVVIILFQAAFAVTHNYILGFIGHRITADFRIELFSHIQSLSLRFFQGRRVGEILSRMSNDITVIQNALVSIPVAVLRQTITLVGALAIIFYLNWKLTGLILLVLPPLMLFARIFGKRLRNLSEKVQDKIAHALVVLEEVASSIKIVKSYTREPYEKKRFENEIESAFEQSIGKVRISSSFGPLILGLTFLVSTILIWYGGQQVMQGTTTPGELAAFFLYALIMAGPIGTFVKIYTQLQETLGAMRRVNEILDIKPLVNNPENPVKRARNRAWTDFTPEFSKVLGSITYAKSKEAQINATESARKFLGRLEEALVRERGNTGPYFNGANLSIVDAAYAPFFMRFTMVEKLCKTDIMKEFPMVDGWRQALVENDIVKGSVVPEFVEVFNVNLRKRDTYAATLLDAVNAAA